MPAAPKAAAPAPARPDPSTSSNPNRPGCEFNLFRCTQPTADVTYVGSIKLPGGAVHFIEAWVVDHPEPDGKTGKHFEGRVVKASGVLRHFVRGAKKTGNLPDDLVAAMDGMPFDDPLPPLTEAEKKAEAELSQPKLELTT